MKSFGVVLLLLVICFSVYGKPFPSSTVVKESTSTTPKPWLRFLQDKKTTTPIPTTEMPNQKDMPVNLIHSSIPPSHQASVTRAVGSAPGSPPVLSQSSIDEFINNLVAYFEPSQYTSSQLAPSAPNILAQDRKLNPDTLYDELYLDWMKKREAEPAVLQSLPAEDSQGVVPAQNPEYPSYAAYPPMAYPPMPLSYSPFYPLASLKMQKAMAQAQMDAALTAMNITTTPKPIKLKLKISIPGGADLSQISAITNNLPPGSTFTLN